ncbi:hypothetical protein [Massilia phosphatilytica]
MTIFSIRCIHDNQRTHPGDCHQRTRSPWTGWFDQVLDHPTNSSVLTLAIRN